MSSVKNIYSIYDLKAKNYGVPFSVLNDDLALRILDQLLQNPDTDYRRYPDDFVVYAVGTFDDASAFISSETPPRLVCSVRARLDYLIRLASESRSNSDEVCEQESEA